MSDGARWWHRGGDGRIHCDLCPRRCKLREGQRAFCFVRGVEDGRMVLHTYGRGTGFCIDPIEKKPLNHFLPGTPVLSFGTAGCNLGCKFCQNWDISKSKDVARRSSVATPEGIAQTAADLGCRSVAFTYNDPVVWAEYAIDTAAACRRRGLKSVAVTAGYVTEEARAEFFGAMDAVNVDLKAFSQHFYKNLCFADLGPVLDTLAWIRRETDLWLEVTTLVIPGQNDTDDELMALSEWCMEHLGPDTPLHFSAFHPDFKMQDTPATPPGVLRRARDLARAAGLRHVYTGNVHDAEGDTTRCAQCGDALIERDWYEILRWGLGEGGDCRRCGAVLPGVFEARPGAWGRRRQPVQIANPKKV